jgi:hypothetical protein
MEFDSEETDDKNMRSIIFFSTKDNIKQ